VSTARSSLFATFTKKEKPRTNGAPCGGDRSIAAIYLSIKPPRKGRMNYFGASVAAGAAPPSGALLASGAGSVFTGAFFSPQPVTAMADTSSTIANKFFIALVS
jgi:hypothetical protein